MKLNILLLVLLVFLSASISGCTSTEKTEMLHYDVVLTGDYYNPAFDFSNFSRNLEMAPLLKQPRYDKIVDSPSISCRIFFKQDVISYETSETYNGAGTYHFTIAFKDNVILPQSNETVTVLIKIYDDNKFIKKEYLVLTWPEALK